jgi:tRNA(Ser,Leu) C12 N-acetylase TAN1
MINRIVNLPYYIIENVNEDEIKDRIKNAISVIQKGNYILRVRLRRRWAYNLS